MTPRLFIRFGVVGLSIWLGIARVHAAHLTRNQETAHLYGVHEIVLTTDAPVAHPFDVSVQVVFLAPDGTTQTVRAFYDGGTTWKARVYVSTTGDWQWRAETPSHPSWHQRSGSFTAQRSTLRGKLRQHSRNPRQWMTDNGQTFLNISDTAYYLFSDQALDGTPISEESFQAYVTDAVHMGITSVRASITRLRDEEWTSYFAEQTRDELRLESFQRTDARLEWMLNHYPGLYVQLILVPESNTGWKKDETFWKNLPPQQKTRLMDYILARFAAWPQIFWLIGNDYGYGSKNPNNNALAEEWGQYFKAHDPWQHLLSTGRNRNEPAPFPGADWNSYIHLETSGALTAPQIPEHAAWPLHVFNGEDQYEYPVPEKEQTADEEGNPFQEPIRRQGRLYSDHAQYFYRWLFWSWMLSGGSANYGTADWNKLRPYRSTSYVGLHSVRHILPFFTSRHLDLAEWTPEENLARDADDQAKPNEVKASRRQHQEILVYHPNAAKAGLTPELKKSAARLRLDLSGFPARLRAEWFRPHDGLSTSGGTVEGGSVVELTAPWEGFDVVLYLKPE